jgi:cell division septum initiation protein DivIVA
MTDYTVKELEQKIMNGETVSPSELADAMRNADAVDRIAELTTQRTVRNAQADAAKLAELKEQAGKDIIPLERMRLGYEISDMEKNK